MTTLILHRDLGKRAYRMKCRFTIEAHPTRESLRQGALKAMEMFVKDMAKMKEKWQYLPEHRPQRNGPFTPVVPMTIRRARAPTAREMQYAVAEGARFLAGAETLAQTVTPLDENESWEYELGLVFVTDTIRFEVPDRHEEKAGTR